MLKAAFEVLPTPLKKVLASLYARKLTTLQNLIVDYDM